MKELLLPINKTETMHIRENQYDLLRILSMTAVVFIHAVTSEKSFLQQFFLTVFGFSVPIFFMLSGAFTLNNANIIKNLKKYYLGKFYKIVIPTLLFSFFYFCWDLFLRIKSNGFLDIGSYLSKSLAKWVTTGIPGNGYHLWFMNVIVFFYIIAPFLLFLKNNYKNIYIYIYITLYIISMAWFYLCQINLPYYVRWLFYLPVIMTGDIIKELKKYFGKKIKFAIIIVAVIFFAAEYFLKIQLLNDSKNQLIYFLIHDGYRSNIVVDPATLQIFNLAFSICVFCLFSSLKIKKNFSRLAEMSFYVYLIHYVLEGIVLSVMVKMMTKYGINFSIDSFCCFFVRGVIVLGISVVCAMGLFAVKDNIRIKKN